MNAEYFQVATSSLASIWATAVVLLGIIACGVLLYTQGKAVVKKNPGEGSETMGHKWDGDLEEYNNPLPAWWRNLFYITIVFALIYLALYPGLVAFGGGAYQWTSAGQLAADAAKQEAALQKTLVPWSKKSVEDLAKDPDAMNSAKLLFLNNCARCHASDGRGDASLGYPNLTDKDWLWGGTAEAITATLTGGRIGMMPGHKAILGSDEKVKEAAHYVMSLSGQKHDQGLAELGKKSFETICAACHGVEGKGNQMLGAPNLTDNIWLHGGSYTQIVKSINNGWMNQMPKWDDILGKERIHLLAAYVYSMGGGVAPAAPAAVAQEVSSTTPSASDGEVKK